MSAHRMSPDEYFWHYDFRFDLRTATRGEQEAVRTVFLAQKIDLDGFTWKHAGDREAGSGAQARGRDDGRARLHRVGY